MIRAHHNAPSCVAPLCCSMSPACNTCPPSPLPTLLHTLSLARVHSLHPSSPSQTWLNQSEERRTVTGQSEGGRLALPCSWQDGRRPVGDPCFEGVVMDANLSGRGFVRILLPGGMLSCLAWVGIRNLDSLCFVACSLLMVGWKGKWAVNRSHFWKSLRSRNRKVTNLILLHWHDLWVNELKNVKKTGCKVQLEIYEEWSEET